jgi:OOP family OmpA-OmpF porin
MRLRTMLLATAVAAVPLIARAQQAQPVAGLYVGAGVGPNIMQNEPVDKIGGVSVSGVNLQNRIGFGGNVALGWGFGNGLRAELEFDGRYNVINNVNTPAGSVTAGGHETKYGPMVNIAYDFNGVSPYFVPYIGVGAGYQWASINASVAGSPYSSSSPGAFAYQAILGAGTPMPIPGLTLTFEYRFMGLAGNRNYVIGGAPVQLGNDFNHEILLGLRYSFGAAPPPAPVIPVAEVGAKTFLVFFDWDRADLTARSMGIIQDAASYSQGTKYTRIDVDGNTDTSGTPTYNQGLSERRARVVAAQLVRDGVPQSAIAMHAYGDTHLLVPTGPNVREPQNRRVDIVYH